MASIKATRYVNGELARGVVEVYGEGIVELPNNLIVLPGFVDMHVHMRDWGQWYKEDLHTASKAALAGGVVAVGDMPNTIPQIRSVDLALRRLRDSANLPIIYRLHGGVPRDPSELINYTKAGVKSIKVYPEDLQYADPIISTASKLDMLVIVHCEDPEMFRSMDGKDASVHNTNRPPESEVSCLLKVARAALRTGARVHITHVSNPAVVSMARELKGLVKITMDSTPHHLLLDYEECTRTVEDPFYCKVNPPLRDRETRTMLMKQLLDGSIDAVASDHAPHASFEKFGRGYWDTESGFPGLETTAPLLLNLWRMGIISLSKVIELYSEGPANLMGISLDGSYVVVDIKNGHVIDPNRFMSKAKHSPFAGRWVSVTIAATIVRGRLMMVRGSYEGLFKGLIDNYTMVVE